MDATRAARLAPLPHQQKLSKLGDYRLLKKLGEGGMGTVYKAHQESLDRDVAVKVLFKHLAANSSFVDRFQREARIMAKLDHANILRCSASARSMATIISRWSSSTAAACRIGWTKRSN